MEPPLDISAGRRFSCTRCGNCCRRDGYVFFNYAELTKMAAKVGLTKPEFRAAFGVRDDEKSDFLILEAKDGKGCPLLTEAGHCRVHEVKPRQCAGWPFWPEMLDEAKAWEDAKAYCPGLDASDGRLYSAHEILEILEIRASTDEINLPPKGVSR